MTTRHSWKTVLGCTTLGLLAVALSSGCSIAVNHFKEDGPSTTMNWDSPTTADVKARFKEAEPRERGWTATTVAAESGKVYHYPLYLENPFVDKGRAAVHPEGWTEPDELNVYRAGWEDYVALPYSPARYMLNVLLFPASTVVTPPWTVMESDGQLSKQLLGYDHDATPSHDFVPQAPPAPLEKSTTGQPENAPAAPSAAP